MRYFVTADLHLGHKKIIEYEPARTIFSTIKEHDDHIEMRWRETVRPQDVVLVVGDVVWNREALGRFRSFPGIKKLVLGNHDALDMQAYLKCFRKVVAYAEVDGWLVSHVPAHPSSVVPRFKGQIHGHTHGLGSPEHPYVQYRSACVEMHDFAPVLLEKLT
jgi:calcineurin-like phosphoesterase family protein